MPDFLVGDLIRRASSAVFLEPCPCNLHVVFLELSAMERKAKSQKRTVLFSSPMLERALCISSIQNPEQGKVIPREDTSRPMHWTKHSKIRESPLSPRVFACGFVPLDDGFGGCAWFASDCAAVCPTLLALTFETLGSADPQNRKKPDLF